MRFAPWPASHISELHASYWVWLTFSPYYYVCICRSCCERRFVRKHVHAIYLFLIVHWICWIIIEAIYAQNHDEHPRKQDTLQTRIACYLYTTFVPVCRILTTRDVMNAHSQPSDPRNNWPGSNKGENSKGNWTSSVCIPAHHSCLICTHSKRRRRDLLIQQIVSKSMSPTGKSYCQLHTLRTRFPTECTVNFQYHHTQILTSWIKTSQQYTASGKSLMEYSWWKKHFCKRININLKSQYFYLFSFFCIPDSHNTILTSWN